MKYHYNHVELSGRMHGEINAVINAHGDTIYEGILAVKRHSGTDDLLPISIPAELVGSVTDVTRLYGRHLHMVGEMRSFNKNMADKGRHFTTILIREIADADQAEDDNRVELEGVICKRPVYRETPFGRKICDIMLAVNHGHRSSYIPCIFWGKTAAMVAMQDVGTTIMVSGRYQSREYQKVLDIGETVTRITRELSCDRVCIAVQEGAEV